MPVLPDPIQLSRTTLFSCVYVLIKYSSNSIGFSVGCNLLRGCTGVNSKILVGCLSVYVLYCCCILLPCSILQLFNPPPFRVGISFGLLWIISHRVIIACITSFTTTKHTN